MYRYYGAMFSQIPYVPETLKVPSSALYLTLTEPRRYSVLKLDEGVVRRVSAMYRLNIHTERSHGHVPWRSQTPRE